MKRRPAEPSPTEKLTAAEIVIDVYAKHMTREQLDAVADELHTLGSDEGTDPYIRLAYLQFALTLAERREALDDSGRHTPDTHEGV